MNTMNLVTTTPTTNTSNDLTMLASQDLEAWFAGAGLAVTEVAHCASASCPLCFAEERLADHSDAVRAA